MRRSKFLPFAQCFAHSRTVLMWIYKNFNFMKLFYYFRKRDDCSAQSIHPIPIVTI